MQSCQTKTVYKRMFWFGSEVGYTVKRTYYRQVVQAGGLVHSRSKCAPCGSGKGEVGERPTVLRSLTQGLGSDAHE